MAGLASLANKQLAHIWWSSRHVHEWRSEPEPTMRVGYCRLRIFTGSSWKEFMRSRRVSGMTRKSRESSFTTEYGQVRLRSRRAFQAANVSLRPDLTPVELLLLPRRTKWAAYHEQATNTTRAPKMKAAISCETSGPGAAAAQIPIIRVIPQTHSHRQVSCQAPTL